MIRIPIELREYVELEEENLLPLRVLAGSLKTRKLKAL